MPGQRRPQRGQGIEVPPQKGQGFAARVTGRRLFALPRRRHAVGRQAVPAGFQVQGLLLRIRGPGPQGIQPAPHARRLIRLQISPNAFQPTRQFVGSLHPGLLQGLKALPAVGAEIGAHPLQILRRRLGQPFPREQRPEAQQLLGPRPDRQNVLKNLTLQAGHLGAPVVPGHLPLLLIQILLKAQFEQAAAIECMFAQHPLAPAVDREDRRFVHGLRGQFQRMGAPGPLRFGILRPQGRQELVLQRPLARKPGCRLGQTSANPVPQFAGGCLGEGQHQDLRGQAGGLAAMPQHQPHVQRRDGPGLARPRARLDEAAAAQLEAQGLHGENFRTRHSASPRRLAAGSPRAASSAPYRRSAHSKKPAPCTRVSKSG
ncbi:hypothetical protein CDEF62S_02539 [Castellaniella defragrans]